MDPEETLKTINTTDDAEELAEHVWYLHDWLVKGGVAKSKLSARFTSWRERLCEMHDDVWEALCAARADHEPEPYVDFRIVLALDSDPLEADAWSIRIGDAQYDTDHHGHFGAGSVNNLISIQGALVDAIGEALDSHADAVFDRVTEI